MQTTFFEQVASLKLEGDLRLNIQVQTDGQMIVSVLLSNKQVKDKAVKKIPPLVLTGTSTEVDEGFFPAITAPLQKTNTLLCNISAHEKAFDKASKENRIVKDKEADLKKEKDAKRKKFDEQMKKVDELEKKNKIGEAIGALPKLSEFPMFEEEIKKKSNALRNQHGSLSLFDPPASSQEDSNSNDSHDENDEEEQEEEGEEEEQDEDDRFDEETDKHD